MDRETFIYAANRIQDFNNRLQEKMLQNPIDWKGMEDLARLIKHNAMFMEYTLQGRKIMEEIDKELKG